MSAPLSAPVAKARPAFVDVLADFLRLFVDAAPPAAANALDAPSLHRPDAAELLAAAGGAAAAPALAALLEDRFDARGFFAAPHACFSSRFFDPARALYSAAAVPPFVTARPLDNLHKAQALLPPQRTAASAAAAVTVAASPAPLLAGVAAGRASHSFERADLLAWATAVPAAAPAAAAAAAVAGPRLHLGPLHSEEVERRDRQRRDGSLPPSLLEWLADDAAGLGEVAAASAGTGTKAGAVFGAGPWPVLHALFAQRCRVRVTVRWQHAAGIGAYESVGGTLTGALRGFDRHWNLLLFDSEWEAAGDIESAAEAELAEEAEEGRRRKRPRPLPDRSGCGGARQAPVLVRGEHVVCVARAAAPAAARDVPC